MAWLTSLFKKPETVDDERTPGENGAHPPPAAGGPPLAILAPDIAGVSAFRLRFFADAAAAAADIEQLPPDMRRGTHAFWALHDEPVLPPDGHREALVLIRANLTSDIVYAVSFVDMESAWSFARFEAKRGLDISHLVILWAAFATVREELDGVSVLPAAAPETKAQHATPSALRSVVGLEATEAVREYERQEEPAINNGAATAEAPADEAKLAEAEAEQHAEAEEAARRTEAAEAARRTEAEEAAQRAEAAEAAQRAEAAEAAQRTEAAEAARRAEAEEAARIATQAQEELREARAAADAARAVAEAETIRRTEAEGAARRAEAEEATRRTEAEEAAQRAEAEETTRRAETEEAARIATQAQEELREARAAADAARAQAEAEATLRQEAERRLEAQTQAAADAARSRALTETGSSAAAEQTLTDDALDDGDEPAARGTIFAHAPATETEEDTETIEIPAHLSRAEGSEDPDDDLPKAPDLDDFDIAYEVARLLENRRWDKREEPFQGFDSPPGKF